MSKLTASVLTVALAGFLFGFDTIVISGADEPIQALWGTGAWFHGVFIMSMALWGTVVGALLGGVPTDRLGRRRTLFWIGVLYLVSALGSALATDPYAFSAFRFLGGLGVGASSVAAPSYIAEIAPAEKRGRLGATYQFNIVLGILAAFLSNALLGAAFGEGAWRYMLGVEAAPALAYCLLVLGVPESPRWLLLRRGDAAAAGTAIAALEPDADVEARIRALRATSPGASGRVDGAVAGGDRASVFAKAYRRPLTWAFLIAVFNQLSGINFLLYYAPRIFAAAGVAADDTLAASIPIGVVNLVFTLLGVALIDRTGRRTLLTVGCVGYVVTLLGVAASFYTGAEGYVVVAFVTAFVAAHAVGQGAVIWVFLSEVFPTAVRAAGVAFGSSTHWVLAAAITMVTPAVLAAFAPWRVFAFFAAVMAVQLWWVRARMPETRGVEVA